MSRSSSLTRASSPSPSTASASSSSSRMLETISLSASASDIHSRRTLYNISLAVAKSKKIVVVTGAGISCSCGIPDFRSSDGLYNLVKQQYPDVVLKGRDLFDAALFRDPTSTSVFYTFISKLKQSIDNVTPSPTHWFLSTLNSKGKLLRSYTQNIDGLEERVGLLGSASLEAKANAKSKSKIKLKDVKNVQLHGDVRLVRCTFCCTELPFSPEYASAFLEGEAPDCPECVSRSEARVARSARALRIGKLRPAIVLYDEPHPLGDDIGSIETVDLSRKPDLLIIMGTSLKVHGLKKLVKEFAKSVHATGAKSKVRSPLIPKGKVIFVNKTAPSSEWDGIIDYHVEGETDAWVERVLDDWKKARPADWEVQTTLDSESTEHPAAFKAQKSTAQTTRGKGKAKASTENMENIPPPPKRPSKPSEAQVQPPSSPSKRRQRTCHYSDIDSSPTKKKASSTDNVRNRDVPSSERGMLFNGSRKANVVVDIDLDDLNKTNVQYQDLADMSLDSPDVSELTEKLAVQVAVVA